MDARAERRFISLYVRGKRSRLARRTEVPRGGPSTADPVSGLPDATDAERHDGRRKQSAESSTRTDARNSSGTHPRRRRSCQRRGGDRCVAYRSVPLVRSGFGRPLHPMPDDALAFTVRIQRRASAREAPDHRAMLTANEALVRRLVPAGAKIYPPFAPVLFTGDWQRHYGAVWPRLENCSHCVIMSTWPTPRAGSTRLHCGSA